MFEVFCYILINYSLTLISLQVSRSLSLCLNHSLAFEMFSLSLSLELCILCHLFCLFGYSFSSSSLGNWNRIFGHSPNCLCPFSGFFLLSVPMLCFSPLQGLTFYVMVYVRITSSPAKPSSCVMSATERTRLLLTVKRSIHSPQSPAPFLL